ncbi:MAG: hypothetical protein GYA23_04135 [Methanomicrobiales archaeon]|nr:hypothetical protein [Methanomicrobiales archaeon]
MIALEILQSKSAQKIIIKACLKNFITVWLNRIEREHPLMVSAPVSQSPRPNPDSPQHLQQPGPAQSLQEQMAIIK